MSSRNTGWLSVATAAILCLALSSCMSDASKTDTDTSAAGDDFSSANVDTPALRAQKAAAGIEDCPQVAGSRVDRGLPDVTLPCLGGGPAVRLGGLRGPAVINLWATYCGPCRSEAPLFESAYSALGDQMEILGVDYQEPDPGKAIAFADELGLTFPMVADPYADLKAGLRLQGLPMTLFVDNDGAVVYTQAGPIESESELADLLHEHLDVDPGWAG